MGIGWPATVTQPECISGCSKEEENKSLFFFFSFFHCFTLLLKMLDSGLATAYRNGTYCNKGRRDGKLSKDQHGAQLKESKELLISKNVSPPQCYPIKTQDH